MREAITGSKPGTKKRKAKKLEFEWKTNRDTTLPTSALCICNYLSSNISPIFHKVSVTMSGNERNRDNKDRKDKGDKARKR